MYYVQLRRNLLGLLISGILVLGGASLFAGTEPEVQQAAQPAYESFRTDDVFTPLHKLREHNAVVQYHETRAGLQVSYSGIKHLKITAAAGCTIVRDFDFFRVGVSERTDPAPYVQLSADLRF